MRLRTGLEFAKIRESVRDRQYQLVGGLVEVELANGCGCGRSKGVFPYPIRVAWLEMLERQLDQLARVAGSSTGRFVRHRCAAASDGSLRSRKTRARSQSVSLRRSRSSASVARAVPPGPPSGETGRPHLRASGLAFSGCAWSASTTASFVERDGKLNLECRIARRRLQALRSRAVRASANNRRAASASPRWRSMFPSVMSALTRSTVYSPVFRMGPGSARGVSRIASS